MTVPANRLRDLREQRDLHLVEVAAVCKVGERTVRRWENCEVAIPDHHKLRLAEYFEISPAQLMGWEPEEAVA